MRGPSRFLLVHLHFSGWFGGEIRGMARKTMGYEVWCISTPRQQPTPASRLDHLKRSIQAKIRSLMHSSHPNQPPVLLGMIQKKRPRRPPPRESVYPSNKKKRKSPFRAPPVHHRLEHVKVLLGHADRLLQFPLVHPLLPELLVDRPRVDAPLPERRVRPQPLQARALLDPPPQIALLAPPHLLVRRQPLRRVRVRRVMAVPRRALASAEAEPRRHQQADQQAVHDVSGEDRADGVDDGAEDGADGLEEAPALLGRDLGGAVAVAGRARRQGRLALAAALLTAGSGAVERVGPGAGRDGGLEPGEEVLAELRLALVCAAFDGTWTG